MATAVTVVILVFSLTLAVKKMMRDRRSGKSLQCGGDCSRCRGCH